MDSKTETIGNRSISYNRGGGKKVISYPKIKKKMKFSYHRDENKVFLVTGTKKNKLLITGTG